MLIAAASPLDRMRNTYTTSEVRPPTDCADSSQRRCHNCSCGTR